MPRLSSVHLLILLGVLLLGKSWLAASLPLFGDEAFYWLEAQHLAVAFDDVPAATPWLIALGETLGGGETWAVRAPFLLLSLLTWAMLWRLAREFVERSGALLILLIAALIPLHAANGLLAVPDVPLNLAFVVCAFALVRFQRDAADAPRWLLLGLILGWLSHYRFVVPLAAAGLALLLTAEGRALLRRPGFWVTGLAGNTLGLLPLLWQQWRSGGAGLMFQYSDRHPWQFQWEPLADPLLQALITSPILYGLLLWAGFRLLKPQAADVAPALRLLAAVGLAVVVVYWVLGVFADSERSRLHWPLPGYLALAVVLGVLWQQRVRGVLGWGLGLAALCIGLGGSVLLVHAHAPARLAAGSVYAHNLAGWPQAIAATRAQLRDLPPDTVVVADNFMLAAELQFGLGGASRVYSLDHPLNHKHGRAGELRRMQRDAASIPAASASQPRLIVAEESATRLRQRGLWYQALCQQFPQAAPRSELSIHHGRKRLLFWLDRGESLDRCLPPILGYIAEPQWGQTVQAGQPIVGWALRGAVGVAEVRARVAEHVIPLQYGAAVPTLEAQLGRLDPHQPAVGLLGTWPELPMQGRQWLILEGRSHDGDWSELLQMPVELP